jgi:multidrug resistance efflux pump
MTGSSCTVHSLEVNQGIAFSRTLRALDADDFRASKLGLLVAVALLAAWSWWMLAARVRQYESTSNVRIESGVVVAYFPSTIRIHPGQSAVVTLDGKTSLARVQSVAPDHAELDLVPNPQSPIPASSSSSADIEVSQVSPASVALQSLGRRKR